MKVTSKRKLIYSADREGIKESIIEIDFKVINRNDSTKTITLVATDSIIDENGNKRIINNKVYEKTYVEYNQLRDFFFIS